MESCSHAPIVMDERIRFFPQGPESDDSERDINFWDEQSSPGNEREEVGKALGSFKYIDDTTVFESVPMATAIRHITSGPTIETIAPDGLGHALGVIAERANDIGMKVNVGKTQLLCLPPRNGCSTSASIATSNGPVHSGKTMKLVGFTFGSDLSVSAHVDTIREDYRVKIWFLFHLREAGIKHMSLYKLYCCYLRSRIEYLSAAYHSMLLKGQSEALERLHRVCFGFHNDIRDLMAERSIETLEDRRARRSDRFISKASRNPRFGHWFPPRPTQPIALRKRREIQETRSRTSRRHNGPLAYLKRRANELGLTCSQ